MASTFKNAGLDVGVVDDTTGDIYTASGSGVTAVIHAVYISNLRQRNSHKKLNKAFSNSAVSLSFFLENNLNKVGMSLSQKNIFSNIKLNNKFIKLLRHNLTYKKIVSNTLDQIIPYKKFKINFSNFEYFDLEKADKDYENIIT